MDICAKTAIVTGGASGLGRATAERYAADGANVAIFDINDQAGKALAQALGSKVIYQHVNVAEEASVQQAIDKTADTFGDIHIVSNYAGIGIPAKTYGKKGPCPLPDYMQVIMVNQVGTFNMCRLAAEKMAANQPVNEDGVRGVLINTASVAAYEGQIGQVSYSASKGAIVGMTLPMARDLATYGIRVVTIAPGLIHTPLFEALDEKVYQSLAASTVFPQRLGKASEVASLAAHIVENDYLNGEVIRLDAAIRMQPR